MKALLLVVLAAALAAAGAREASAAATLNVPGDYPSIQAALNVASAGDTIVVAPGTYVENLDFAGKDVIVRAEGGAGVTTLDANNATGVRMGPGGWLEGFTITRGRASFGAGIEVSGTGSRIRGNVFEANAQTAGGFGAGIGGNVASPIIEGNVFRGNSCDDQFLSGVVAFVNRSSPLIQNNVFADNSCRAINMTVPVEARPFVVNNTIVRNPVGIRVDGRVDVSSSQTYRNNVIVANGVGLLVEFSSGPIPAWDHNLVWGNGTDYAGLANQTGINGNLSANPIFVESASSDFHLDVGSPAIDAGSNIGVPSLDFDGNARPLDGNGDGIAVADIGAYEVVPQDLQPPVISAPDMVLNATAPTGANVTYSVSVTDDTDPSPTLTCTPSSGSLFPIGTRTVSCVATDFTGKSSTATFSVTVLGALDQIAALRNAIASVQDAKLRKALDVKLRDAANGYRAGNLSKACNNMSEFASLVAGQSGRGIPAPTASQWVADAARIKSVMGCP